MLRFDLVKIIISILTAVILKLASFSTFQYVQLRNLKCNIPKCMYA